MPKIGGSRQQTAPTAASSEDTAPTIVLTPAETKDTVSLSETAARFIGPVVPDSWTFWEVLLKSDNAALTSALQADDLGEADMPSSAAVIAAEATAIYYTQDPTYDDTDPDPASTRSSSMGIGSFGPDYDWVATTGGAKMVTTGTAGTNNRSLFVQNVGVVSGTLGNFTITIGGTWTAGDNVYIEAGDDTVYTIARVADGVGTYTGTFVAGAAKDEYKAVSSGDFDALITNIEFNTFDELQTGVLNTYSHAGRIAETSYDYICKAFLTDGSETSYSTVKTATTLAGDDTEVPTATITMPATSSTLVNPISWVVADNLGTGGLSYFVSETETPTEPAAGDPGWSATVINFVTASAFDTLQFNGYVKDAANNISVVSSATIIINQPAAETGIHQLWLENRTAGDLADATWTIPTEYLNASGNPITVSFNLQQLETALAKLR